MNDLATGASALRADRWRAWMAAGLCLAAIVPVAGVAWHEGQAARLAAAMSGAPDSRAEVIERFADTAPSDLNDRANAALAQGALAAAAETQGPLREFYFARAQAATDHLRQTRPDWAPTLLLVAQGERLRFGAATGKALGAYAASYRAAPFLHASAQWRIAFGAENWAALAPQTRAAMIDEAVWFTAYDGSTRPAILGLLGDSPAGMAYAMKLGR